MVELKISLFLLATIACAYGHSNILKRDTAAQEGKQIAQAAMNKHQMNEELRQKVADLREGCFPRPSGVGCRCVVKDVQGHDQERIYQNDGDCRAGSAAFQQEQIDQTATNKERMNEEFKQRVAGLREGCFPRPSGIGCRCVVKNSEGQDLENIYHNEADCKVQATSSPQQQIGQTVQNKQLLNEEFKQRVAGLREGCFPRPSGVGCRCVRKDAEGHDREQIFEQDDQCKVPASRVKREARVQNQGINNEVAPRDRTQQKTNTAGTDPVAERARQNYAAVINELKNKFAGLREGCYPRPKGCLCVVGKDATGREITQRRMTDSECKCAPGERSHDCPAQGA